jgi:hypothetical protein
MPRSTRDALVNLTRKSFEAMAMWMLSSTFMSNVKDKTMVLPRPEVWEPYGLDCIMPAASSPRDRTARLFISELHCLDRSTIRRDMILSAHGMYTIETGLSILLKAATACSLPHGL